MTPAPRTAPAATTALVAGLLCALAACGGGTGQAANAQGTGASGRTAWREPAAYTYTLRSSGGERALLGTFRITVRDGAVAGAVGLDDTARGVAASQPDAVPTLGQLLTELERVRRGGAATAEAWYAADGHPLRIVLDEDDNAVDDEARYDITAYEPAGRG
ncbi:DUF6174 domain-containing protein [Streptomyces sp. NPDC003877]